jgi:CHAT domain-containing protein
MAAVWFACGACISKAQVAFEGIGVSTETAKMLPGEKKARDAIPAAQKTLESARQSTGPDSIETARALADLAGLHFTAGDYAEALPLFTSALEIRKKKLGAEHRDTAASLNDLAEFHAQIADYEKAEQLHLEALRIREKLNPDDLDTAASRTNLGKLYLRWGRTDEAGPLLEKALAVRERDSGPQHIDTAYTLKSLAEFKFRTGGADLAKPFATRALEIFTTKLGANDPNAEDMRNIGGVIADKMVSLIDAIVIGRAGTDPRVQMLSGPFNTASARNLSDGAELQRQTGKPDDYKQALKMHERALRMREQILGPDQPDTLESLEYLSLLLFDMGTADRVPILARQALYGQAQYLNRIFSFTDEQQRLAFQAATRPYSLFASLREVPAPDLALAILRFKGAVLDSLIEDRREKDAEHDPELARLVGQVRRAKERLGGLDLEASNASEDKLKRIEPARTAVRTEIAALESELDRRGLGSGGLALGATVPQVQSAIPRDAALIEMIRFPRYLGKGQWANEYGAIVLRADGDPIWIVLGPATDIEAEIVLYQKSARGETDEHTLRNVLTSLAARVWKPIAQALPPGTRQVILSPDGALNLVSFSTLLASGDRFLCEDYSIRYVASGRDLIARSPAEHNKTLLVFANPEFCGEPALASDGHDGRILPQLPGTESEAAKIEMKATGWGLPAARIFRGENATERALAEVRSPEVLHLATHGLLLSEEESANAGEARRGPNKERKNPMRGSALALAGARRTHEAWLRGDLTPSMADGIVTAEEVAALQLSGTWLVTLSACNTGAGQAAAGEGVLGLRRSFIQAGAQNLLMTLWPISDETTVQIMLDFYERAFQTGDAPQALAEVQRGWLAKLRKERGLLAAVRLAGPFIMNSQGRSK